MPISSCPCRPERRSPQGHRAAPKAGAGPGLEPCHPDIRYFGVSAFHRATRWPLATLGLDSTCRLGKHLSAACPMSRGAWA